MTANFIEKIAILGGESSGKSTLTANLAIRLNTMFTTEYGREIWLEKKGLLHYEDLLHIAQVQIAREDTLLKKATRWLVCDTTPLTTLFYSLNSFNRVDPELFTLAERPYEHVFICSPEIPFDQDGTRTDAAFRTMQDHWYQTQLKQRNIPYQIVSGTVDERVEQILRSLRA